MERIEQLKNNIAEKKAELQALLDEYRVEEARLAGEKRVVIPHWARYIPNITITHHNFGEYCDWESIAESLGWGEEKPEYEALGQ